ncbi:MAG: hypothetical protein IJ808_01525 [Muribaculaceae bacterium]|nr:hypothetical protein [Muribaculaceae bacterium]
MKKILLLVAAAIMAVGAVQAKTADELRIYLNPGHGSYGPNDRPMNTINHPNTTSLTDTLGFFEGRGTLPRAFGIGTYLQHLGVKKENITYSRLTNGPWPYTSENYDPDDIYNRNLTDICEEVEAGNYDIFISDHSNAATDGTTTNYPLFLVRGYDKDKTGDAGYNGAAVPGSYEMADAVWDTHYMSELDPQSYYSLTSKNLRGDISFYGSYSTGTRSNGKQYSGYLGVLKHGVPGFLLEGFFHTYQPARHRALNMDYDRQEGRREARGVGNYFGLTPYTKGDIMGTVKDLHEKIAHELFKYAPKTNDQWLPLNGATVRLLKDGNVVATYTVDNEYNGIFVFEDLEPGDYTLDASLDGYKPLFDEYKAPITVKANETVYSTIFLESESYVPEEVHYENYPEPNQPNYLKLADEYTFSGENTVNFEVKGKVTDAVQYGDSTIILSNEGLTPHLYLINSKTQTLVKELNVEGLYTEESTGFYSPLYSIALTADKKLVGSSYTRNQYDAGYVDAGYTRGTTRFYIWDEIDGAPRQWVTTQNSGNYFRADLGQSIAVNGASNDCSVLVTAVNRGASPYNIRLVHLTVTDNELVSVFHDNLFSAGFTAVKYGDDTQGGHLHVAVSPNGDDKAVLGGSNGLVTEFDLPEKQAGVPATVKQLSTDFQLVGYGFNFFKYAKHALMVAPYGEAGSVKGIKLLDITDGLDNAKLIKTNNTDLTIVNEAPALKAPAATAAAAYQAATAVVKSEDIDAYLVSDAYLTRYSTADANQPTVKGIMAYDLRDTEGEKEYTFNFNANSDAVSAKIIFTDAETGEVLGEVEVPNVKEGANTITLSYDQIPGEDEQEMNWAVNLVGKTIPTIARLNDYDTGEYTYSGRLFNTIDKSPESNYFGRIYTANRISQPNANNGVYAYNPDWTRINSERYHGGVGDDAGVVLASPYRMGIDSEGTVYVPDWSDPYSGVYVVDPANLEGDFTQFFLGTRDGDGLFTNDGVKVGGSAPSVAISGEGANTVMYVYNEDVPGPSGRGNGVGIYNIGQEDGTILHTWGQAPSNYFDIGAYQANTNGSIVPDGNGGVWVAQTRGAGNNTTGVPSLLHVNAAGTIDFNSGREPYSDYISGSWGSGFAVNNTNDMLVINDGDATLQFFTLTWEEGVPALAPLYSYKADCRDGSNVHQINFDYAGNLVCSGSKLGIYSIPTEDNQTTVPAQKKLIVMKKSHVAVDDVNASKTVASVKYVNVAGQVSQRPFDGVNIVVTTYTDGTSSSVKVIK